MDWKSFDIFFSLALSALVFWPTYMYRTLWEWRRKEMLCNFGVLFFQHVGTDCTMPSNHVRLRRIRPFRHLSPRVPIHQMMFFFFWWWWWFIICLIWSGVLALYGLWFMVPYYFIETMSTLHVPLYPTMHYSLSSPTAMSHYTAWVCFEGNTWYGLQGWGMDWWGRRVGGRKRQ